MKPLRILSANMSQGLIYEGIKAKKDVFSKYWPSAYFDIYASLQPDLACLTEVPLDDHQGHSQFLTDFAAALDITSYHVAVQEKSWLVEGKYYGNAILSKYPVSDYRTDKTPAILAGDFNNGNDHLPASFPELFAENVLADSVMFRSEHFTPDYVGGQYQLDHILYTPQSLRLEQGRVIDDPSDHHGLIAEFALTS